MQILCSWLIATVIAAVFATGVRADVLRFDGSEVAPNIAIITISEQGVSVELEIGVEGFDVFSDILPVHMLPHTDKKRLGEHERLVRFGRETLSVLDEDGKPFPVRVDRVEPRLRVDRASPLAGKTDPFTGQVIPGPPEDPRVIFAKLFYAFNGTNPKQVTFVPPQTSDGTRAVIGMQVTDRKVPVSEFRYLSKPAPLDIDWDDPWHTRFQSPALNRKAQDGTLSFLYVEPREIRHEVLIRLRELAPWVGAQFDTGATLDASAQTALMEKALTVLKTQNPVYIDGTARVAKAARGAYLALDARGFQVVEDSPNLSVNNAFLGAIFSFPVAQLPSDATIDWTMFDGTIQKVPTVLTDPAGPFLDSASPEDAQTTWNNYLKTYVEPKVTPVVVGDFTLLSLISTLAFLISLVGLISAVCATKPIVKASLVTLSLISLGFGVAQHENQWMAFVNPLGAGSEKQLADHAVPDLLSNLYIAALEVTPQARATALAPLVSAGALDELSTELESNLTIRIVGGERALVSSVADVSLEAGQTTLRGAYVGVVSWSVDASAGHWGHDHRRRVQYRAQVEIIPQDGHWKLAALTVLQARTPDA